MDLKDDSAQADYFYVDTLRISSNKESFGRGVTTITNSNRVTRTSNAQTASKAIQQIAAPVMPPMTVTSVSNIIKQAEVFHVYPNPSSQNININYGLNKKGNVAIKLIDLTGKTIQNTTVNAQQEGIYTQTIDISNLAKGVYFFQLLVDGKIAQSGKFIKQ